MPENFFDEKDLRSLFSEANVESSKKKSPTSSAEPAWKIFAKLGGLFLAIFILTFILINFSAISKKFQYFWQVQLFHNPYNKAVATPTPVSTFDPASPAKIVIPKIGVEAPIIWNVPEDQVDEKLLEGVAHSQGTALPGQKGNVFITGHSSYYIWSDSAYKDVFALLENLSPDDKIYVQYQGENFEYEVAESKVVSPGELSVMNQGDSYNLTLMTCVPIGTNLNRLIIIANQIST